MIEQVIQKYKDMLTKKITYSEKVLIKQIIIELHLLKAQVKLKTSASVSKEMSQMFEPESKEASIFNEVGEGLEKIAAIKEQQSKNQHLRNVEK